MLDDSDVKIFTAKSDDSDGSDLFAVAEEIKRNILNGNSAKAKELGKKLATLSPESNDLDEELTGLLRAAWIKPDIKIQLRLLMVFCAEYTLLSELCPMPATTANEVMYAKLKENAFGFYDSISNGAAMSFYYMAVKQRDTVKAVGENFAMLCDAKTSERIKNLGSQVFLLTCKHIVKLIEEYSFEK
ncbi:MAG: hypothetical protein IJ261_04260 [Clostridia bacterium]|nr:hypothetical protein [Clostridia bacterium]